MAFLDALEEHPDVEMHSLMVVRHGHVVVEGWWAPYTSERVHLVYSLSKSFTATAAAFAQAEGLLDLDDTVVSHFPEWGDEITDPASRSIRLRDVATMASGHTRDMLDEALASDPQEPVRGFLRIPPEGEPGRAFAYSQPCTYALASVIQRNAGMTLSAYLRPRLFDPLGIGPVGWHCWPPGREQGFSGLHVRTEDVAKLGQLYLQRGRWGNRQVIPEWWVADATSRHVDNGGRQADVDWEQGYGYQFWMSRHGYRGDGAFGQFCVVLPDHDTVVVTTARTEAMQAVLDAMWSCLLPGLGQPSSPASGPASGPAPGPASDSRLASRLEGLRLPACDAEPFPIDPREWTREPFTARGDTAVGSIALSMTDDVWHVTLTEASHAVTVPVGSSTWTVSAPLDALGEAIPVAASGGFADGRVRIEVIFLETPHRLDIACSLGDRAAELSWRYVPLMGDSLRLLHCPGS
ncbi:MAG: Beta-lactamase class C-like and penicillin binding proteins (PBPs) superfamily [uncultured Nocardioidaceae bacterium]|uniref:Beta-lactamase class C-like and penicillin binding proteins (PBPs) superfamily n=1 Tax=uncultured Nocardioidaceae bacterium TaxID=253824 RepID=A0A6J4M1R2_9ACTN|nr:MAG: Beta-lactamase class C-like and penicillin binding proteins (PBPs) superfamily [uncultured Nocardioidaceae bacterium]